MSLLCSLKEVQQPSSWSINVVRASFWCAHTNTVKPFTVHDPHALGTSSQDTVVTDKQARIGIVRRWEIVLTPSNDDYTLRISLCNSFPTRFH